MTTSRNEERQKGILNVNFVLEQPGRERVREAGKKGIIRGIGSRGIE